MLRNPVTDGFGLGKSIGHGLMNGLRGVSNQPQPMGQSMLGNINRIMSNPNFGVINEHPQPQINIDPNGGLNGNREASKQIMNGFGSGNMSWGKLFQGFANAPREITLMNTKQGNDNTILSLFKTAGLFDNLQSAGKGLMHGVASTMPSGMPSMLKSMGQGAVNAGAGSVMGATPVGAQVAGANAANLHSIAAPKLPAPQSPPPAFNNQGIAGNSVGMNTPMPSSGSASGAGQVAAPVSNQNDLISQFRKYHGSNYNPNSRMDRWKLQQMQNAQASNGSIAQAANMPYKVGFCKAACEQLGISFAEAERLYLAAH